MYDYSKNKNDLASLFLLKEILINTNINYRKYCTLIPLYEILYILYISDNVVLQALVIFLFGYSLRCFRIIIIV